MGVSHWSKQTNVLAQVADPNMTAGGEEQGDKCGSLGGGSAPGHSQCLKPDVQSSLLGLESQLSGGCTVTRRGTPMTLKS